MAIYTQPAGDELFFDFSTEYTQPAGDELFFDFSAGDGGLSITESAVPKDEFEIISEAYYDRLESVVPEDEFEIISESYYDRIESVIPEDEYDSYILLLESDTNETIAQDDYTFDISLRPGEFEVIDNVEIFLFKKWTTENGTALKGLVPASHVIEDWEINLNEDNYCFEFSANVLGSEFWEFCNPLIEQNTIKIRFVFNKILPDESVSSETFQFLIEEREDVYKGEIFKIWGRSEHAFLGEGFSDSITDSEIPYAIEANPWQARHTTVGDSIQFIYDNYTPELYRRDYSTKIYLTVENYPIYRGQFSAQEKYPIDMLKEFADAIGAVIRPLNIIESIYNTGGFVSIEPFFVKTEEVIPYQIAAEYDGAVDLLTPSSRVLSMPKYNKVKVYGPTPYNDRDKAEGGDGSGGTNEDGSGTFSSGTGVFVAQQIWVYDKDTPHPREPVAGASVTINDISQGVTNENGYLETEPFEVGVSMSVQVTHPEYAEQIDTTITAQGSAS